VDAFYFRVLVLHDGKHVWRKILLQYPFVIIERRILAALTLSNDRVGAAAGNNRLDVDPSAVECGRNAAAVFRCPAELPNFGLKFRTELRPLKRTLVEELPELWIFHVFGRQQKAVFTIAARFDQVIKTLNEFLAIDSHDYPHEHFVQLPCQFHIARSALSKQQLAGPHGNREFAGQEVFSRWKTYCKDLS
jgi:hypothetical protein